MRRTCFHVGAGPRAAASPRSRSQLIGAPRLRVSSGPVVFVGAGRDGPIPAEIGLQPVHHFAFVVTRNRVLLGRLRPAVLDAGGDLPAEAVMEPDPSTVRGDSHLEPLAELMRRRDLTSLSVTTPDGVLLGVVRRDDLEATLASGQP
jgi:CBS domain protein